VFADNKARVYYGLLKEPDLQFVQQEEEEEPDNGEGDKPKKKKAKKDPIFSKKSKTDPNAPTVDRMPLPELKDIDKQEKVRALREASKRVNLGPDTLPSICCYTLLNSCHSWDNHPLIFK
jgi:transcription initiation factor TFIID subunit 5